MSKRMISFTTFIILVVASFMATGRPNTFAAFNLKSGAVYVLTNQVSNAVAAFDCAPDGTLTPAGMFSTGGAGNPVAQPGDPPTDPLASQGALSLSDNNKLLFAVNAGSNEISVLSVGKDSLTLVDKVSSEVFVPSVSLCMAICCTCSTRAALLISLDSLSATQEN